MAVGTSSVKIMMNKAFLIIILLVTVGFLGACGNLDETNAPDTLTDEGPSEGSDITGDRRVITGDEALGLYGIDVNNPPTPGSGTSTSQIWFPAKAWVEPSILPYDSEETIYFLPMYSKPELDIKGMWLGDLEAGVEVVLHGISRDSKVCMVEGSVMQGWEAKGWVSCNRLSFTQPE